MGDSDPNQRPVTGYPLHQNGHPPATAYPLHQNGHPPATAYPYQAPPQPSNPYFYPNYNPNPNPNAPLLRRLIAALITVTVIFFFILFILWIVIRPRYPEFSVTSLTLTGFNVSASKVTGEWDAKFRVYNPNKKIKLAYDDVESFVYYKGELLSRTSVPPLSQGTRNLTVVEAQYSAVGAYVAAGAASGMAADLARGSVGFDVRVVADVGYRAGLFKARRRLLRVLCEKVPVSFSTNGGSGNFTGGLRQCLVYS